MNDYLATTLAGLASRLGRFERSLLMEVGAAGQDAYCAALTERLAKQRPKITMGQVSRSLGALKRLGLMTSEQQWPITRTKHMRHRLVFRLTDTGRTVISALNERDESAGSRETAPALFV